MIILPEFKERGKFDELGEDEDGRCESAGAFDSCAPSVSVNIARLVGEEAFS